MVSNRTFSEPWLILAVLCCAGLPGAAMAEETFFDDVGIENADPALIFDDTSTAADGNEWVIRGRDEFFSIDDDINTETYLYIDAAKLSVALGQDADAGGLNSISLGLTSQSVGSNSAALGFNARSNGGSSLALGYGSAAEAGSSLSLGYLAKTDGPRSAAIGYRATAPMEDTIVIGGVPGQNSGTTYNDVGMGTINPGAPLHVARTDGTAQILVEDGDSNATAKTLFKISSNFNAKFEIDNTDGALWAFTNAGSDFRISRQGSGVVELSIANNGNATLAGALTQNSDVNAKQDIEAVNPDEVLEKVAALPVSTWAYKDAPNARHLGPMAQDFHAAFGLGESDTGISSIDTGGVALAAIQALHRQNDELREDNRALRSELQWLREGLARVQAELKLDAR